MDRIVESVPNFSTSDPMVIYKITQAIKAVSSVKLLNAEPDVDYNRTVVTFVGTPEAVGEAAFQAIAVAADLIDMTHHKGEHPRMGATDVCPFIPVKNVSENECIAIAKTVAQRVAEELHIPTYLYGKAATSPHRVKLSDIRKGEYEGFAEKIKQPEWRPDYGTEFNVKSGATTIGVRGFLIAYNVNIASPDVAIAKEIGGLVRESGRWVEKDGERVRVPGMLKGIQGMGVSLEKGDRKLTQVSMNVLDFQQYAKPHEAFEAVKKLAEERGTTVTGSEIVGLIPLQAILEAGKFYAPDAESQDELIAAANENLGLSDLDSFIPHKKIIELIIAEEPLADLSIAKFVAKLASDAPAPGGGSVAALGGALAAGLATMVSSLTLGKAKYADVQTEMQNVQETGTALYAELLELIDADTEAFNQVMAAFGTPKTNPQRSQLIQQAMHQAAEIPMQVAEKIFSLLPLIATVANNGNKNAITDSGVAALFADAAIKGALYNVRINLLSIKDSEIKAQYSERIAAVTRQLATIQEQILSIVEAEFL